MRYVLVGGSGMLGRRLTDHLLSAGHEVSIISRSPERVQKKPGIRVVGWDGRTALGWGQEVDGADGVVNLVGESIGAARWTTRRKKAIVASRVFAGQAIVEACIQAKKKPGVIFQISGVGYYGISGEKVFTEKDLPGDDFPATTAVQWEAATQPVEELGIRRVVARTGVVLTREGGVLPLMMLPFRLFIGGPLGSGKQWISWVHIDDMVQGVVFLLENQSYSGIFNLTSPNPLTNADFGKALGRVMRRPYWIPAPGFALRIVLGEMSTLVLDGQRVIPQRLIEAGFEFRYPAIADALSALLL